MSNDIRFLRVLDEVEAQGGAHLPGLCKPNTIEYKKHSEAVRDGHGGIFEQQFSAQGTVKTTGCNKEQRFEIPDLVFEGDDESFAPRTTTVCFTDDGMFYWPRFAAAARGDDA